MDADNGLGEAVHWHDFFSCCPSSTDFWKVHWIVAHRTGGKPARGPHVNYEWPIVHVAVPSGSILGCGWPGKGWETISPTVRLFACFPEGQ